ncbi:MAG: hypothetical protein KM310_00230 [Clostridiales bacterium]|nr:hypothetical protein [Clostridiales bacterium]
MAVKTTALLALTLASVLSLRNPAVAGRLAFPALIGVLFVSYLQDGVPGTLLAFRHFLVFWAIAWALNLLVTAFFGKPWSTFEDTEWVGIIGAAFGLSLGATILFWAFPASLLLPAMLRFSRVGSLLPFLLLGVGAAFSLPHSWPF